MTCVTRDDMIDSEGAVDHISKIYNSLYHDIYNQIHLGDISRLASSSIDRTSVGGSHFDTYGTGLGMFCVLDK